MKISFRWVFQVSADVRSALRSLTQRDGCLPSVHADKEWAAGAGKTYTMEGTQENPGINYRTMKELFRCAIEASRALCLPILLSAFKSSLSRTRRMAFLRLIVY